MFDARAGGTYTGTAPSGAPKGTGLNAQGGAGATGQIGNVGVARRPPSACAVGMCLAQATPGGMGAPGYEVRTDGTGGGVPVEEASPILDWLVSRIAPEVAAVINIIIILEEHHAAYVAQMAAKRGAATVGDILKDATPGNISKPGMGSSQYEKSGGLPQANSDFDALTKGRAVKNHPGGIRSSSFPDGSTVSVRPNSGQGAPTLQIDPVNGNPVKVRYR